MIGAGSGGDTMGSGASSESSYFVLVTRSLALFQCSANGLWIGLATLRVAKLVGADFALTIAAPAVRPEFAAEVYRQLVTSLHQSDRPDAICFGPLADEDAVALGLKAACATAPQFDVVAGAAPGAVQTVFALPATFKQYIDSLDKRQRQNYRRDSNLLNREFSLTADVVSEPDAVAAEFQSFVAMHQDQWAAQGRAGHFGDWPGSKAFNEELVADLSKLNRVRLVRLLADGKVIAYQYCFVIGDRCYWRLPARPGDTSWDRFGLGRVGLIRMLEAMIAEGIGWIDAGAGHYPYKVQLGGRERQVVSILLVRKTRLARFRSRIFLKLAAVMHFIYYRLWYLKVAPRFPIWQRPLLQCWIKSRI
jgi:hypothetical protein